MKAKGLLLARFFGGLKGFFKVKGVSSCLEVRVCLFVDKSGGLLEGSYHLFGGLHVAVVVVRDERAFSLLVC